MAAQDSTLTELQLERSKFVAALSAPHTKTGYRYDQRAFRLWASAKGLCPLPATTDTIGLWVTSMLVRKLKVSTCTRRVAAVLHMHRANGYPSPVTDDIRDLLRGAKRLRGEEVDRVLPISVEELRTLSLVLIADDTPVSIRNWAMILTGFSVALRNSSTAGLLLSDVEFVERGAIINLRRSKTDQEGKGKLLGMRFGEHPETCPVRALKKWIERRGSSPGPLFTRFDNQRMRGQALGAERIGQIVQQCVARIGLDPTRVKGHSLRSGFVTAAGQNHVGELLIAATTGHTDMATLRTYFRKTDIWRANASGMLGL